VATGQVQDGQTSHGLCPIQRYDGEISSLKPKVELGSPSKGFATPVKSRRQPEVEGVQPELQAGQISPHSPEAGVQPLTPEAATPATLDITSSVAKDSQESTVKSANLSVPVPTRKTTRVSVKPQRLAY
jgi:hypothetical protein